MKSEEGMMPFLSPKRRVSDAENKLRLLLCLRGAGHGHIRSALALCGGAGADGVPALLSAAGRAEKGRGGSPGPLCAGRRALSDAKGRKDPLAVAGQAYAHGLPTHPGGGARLCRRPERAASGRGGVPAGRSGPVPRGGNGARGRCAGAGIGCADPAGGPCPRGGAWLPYLRAPAADASLYAAL